MMHRANPSRNKFVWRIRQKLCMKYRQKTFMGKTCMKHKAKTSWDTLV